MKMIQCAFDCKFQKDGYCELDKISVVNSISKACPHYKRKSDNKAEGFTEIFYPDNFN